MAFNEYLADRIRQRLAGLDQMEEKNMMGGLTFMYNGKMCIGVVKDEMMCRIDPSIDDEAVEKQGCRQMNFTGKPMKGFVFIDPSGMNSNEDFEFWVGLALNYNAQAKASKRKK